MRIAVTSQNFRTISGHAGKSRRFLVFDAIEHNDPMRIGRLDLPVGMAFHDVARGAHPLDGMDVVVTASAGRGFVAKMMLRGVSVVVTGETDPVRAVRDVLQGHIKPATEHDEPPSQALCCCAQQRAVQTPARARL